MLSHATASFVVAGSAFLLSSCANYSEPSSGAMAYLQIAGPVDALRIGHKSQCGSSEPVTEEQKRGVRISGNSRVYLNMARHGPMSGGCNGSVSFFANEDRSYRFEVFHTAPGACSGRLLVRQSLGGWALDPTYVAQESRGC